MRLIVAGGRDFTNYDLVKKKLDFYLSDKKDVEIVSGCCDVGEVTFVRKDGTKVCGADGLGERYADEKGFHVALFPAAWHQLGKAAGPYRNQSMAKYATHCVVFWDGKSKGSSDMIKAAIQHKLNLRDVRF